MFLSYEHFQTSIPWSFSLTRDHYCETEKGNKDRNISNIKPQLHKFQWHEINNMSQNLNHSKWSVLILGVLSVLSVSNYPGIFKHWCKNSSHISKAKSVLHLKWLIGSCFYLWRKRIFLSSSGHEMQEEQNILINITKSLKSQKLTVPGRCGFQNPTRACHFWFAKTQKEHWLSKHS